MAEYRDRTTGEIKSQGQLRKENLNMSMPKVWNNNVLDALNVDLVLAGPKPTEGIGEYQTVVRNGVTQNSNGDWEQAWQIVDMFSDDPDLGTKAEQEAAYQEGLDNNAAIANRAVRNDYMAETDWWASSDLTMTAEQTAYRQALRDITTHANWPHLSEEDWPTKP